MRNDQPGQAEPFAQLLAAHREIEQRLATLDRAADHLTDESQRADALQTIREVLAYFDGPGADHNADEEQSLFPLLRPLETFEQMLAAFELQHKLNDETHFELRAALEGFTEDSSSRLCELSHRFSEMQRAHIAAEERALFPVAAKALSPEAADALQAAMLVRRNS